MKVKVDVKWWLRVISLTGVGAAFLSPGSELHAADDPNKPNFLFIQTDQFRYDMIRSVQDEMPRYNGKTKIRTPNLDRLRREGAYFKNAYTQCAVCGPARSTFRTGCTLERHGQQTNDLYDDSEYNENPLLFRDKILANETFEQVLVEEKGYIAEHFGKWHMPKIYNLSRDGATRIMRYNDFTCSAMTHDLDLAHVVPKYNSNDSDLDYDEKLGSLSAGLSLVEEPGMQRNTYSHYPYVPDEIDVRYGLPPYTAINPATGLGVIQPDQQGRDTLPANRSSSYFDAIPALAALDRLANESAPFVLTCSFHSPHAPMIAPGLYYDYYKALEPNMLIPDSISGADTANAGWNKELNPDYQNAALVKEWMVSYYALCEEIDYYVGVLLDKLDAEGIADNTIVIFVADHGEALGSHGCREKSKFWEESAHVPMLIRFPGRIAAGSTVDVPVATLDCFATILDYLGASAHDNSDGKSLRRHIEKTNYNQEYDDEVIVTEWDFRDPSGTNSLHRDLGDVPNFLCRKGPWKLMMAKLAASTEQDMLYNIESDPYEVNNYIGNVGMTASDAVVGKAEHLRCLLIEWMQRMDGGAKKYYSDPVWNVGEGNGDIAEITARKKWKSLNIWVSDTAVEVGMPVDVAGQLTRNEYIYLGRTTAGTLTVTNIMVQGADAGLFQLSEFTSGSITNGEYKRVKLTYRPAYYGQRITDARLVIRHSAGADKVVELTAAVPPNAPPTIISTPVTMVDVGNAYNYTVTAIDPETNALSYSSVTLPAWLHFNTNTAVLSGTPSTNDLGANAVTLRVSDLVGSTEQSFTVWVGTVGNDVPVITSSPDTGVIENQAYSYMISAVDVDGDPLTYSASIRPAWLSFNSTNRVLSGTPASTNTGLNFVSLIVSDGSVTVTQNFNIAVFKTPQPVNLIQNGSFELGGTTPASWTMGANSTRSTNNAQEGLSSLKLTTSPGNNSQTVMLQTNTDYTLSVWVNAAGMTSGGIRFDTLDKYDGTTNGLGGTCQFTINLGSALGWTQYTGTFNSSTGTSVTVRTYQSSMVGTVYFDNVVLAPANASNNAPVITSISVTNAVAGSTYRYNLLAADAETSSLVFTGLNIPSWMTFNTNSGVLSGTPSSSDSGSYSVALQVSDGSLSVTQNFTIVVASSGSGYDAWADGQGGAIGTPTIDYDTDGRNNLYEYALHGNPKDDQDNGVEPELIMTGNGFEYIHLQRRGDADLFYVVETRTNLAAGVWTTAGTSVFGTNSYNADYDEVRYSIPAINKASYIRLRIEQR